MGTKKAASYGGKCKVCDVEYKVGETVCMQKDGENWIICKDEECFKQQGGTIEAPKPKGGQFTSQKHKLETNGAIFEIAEGLLAKFYEKRKVTGIDFGNQGTDATATTDVMPKLSLEQEAQFIESMFKTLSGSYKP